MGGMKPVARTEGIITSELDGEMIVYVGNEKVARRLNRPAAIVWRHCDGSRTISDLRDVLAAELGEVADEDVVLVALDTLLAHNLIDSGYEKREDTAMRMSRRRFIKRVGLVGGAAVALPVVSSLVVPPAAAAASVFYSPFYGSYAHDYYHTHLHIYS